MTDIIKELSRPFPAKDVKQRENKGKMLDYLPVNVVEERLNEVLGAGWSWEITHQVIDLPSMTCVITGSLTYHDEAGRVQNKAGIGADEGLKAKKALDDVVKTAEAEALKKAAVKLGVGLFLWREEERQAIADERRGKKREPSPQPDDWKEASRRIFAVVKEVSPGIGLTQDQAFDAVKAMLGVSSSTDATAKQLASAAAVIKSNPKVLLEHVDTLTV